MQINIIVIIAIFSRIWIRNEKVEIVLGIIFLNLHALQHVGFEGF